MSDEHEAPSGAPTDQYEPPEVEELDTEEGPALVGGSGPGTTPG